jgi:hypothetical protein
MTGAFWVVAYINNQKSTIPPPREALRRASSNHKSLLCEVMSDYRLMICDF